MAIALRLLIIVCSVSLAMPATAETETRLALVIGNAAYRHTRVLPNPRNDAEALADLLKSKGFIVTLKTDLDYDGLREAVRAFGHAAKTADVAVVYYAGHGLEVGGQNYLVPVNARLETLADLDYEAVTLASVQTAVSGARRLRLVILDACRNNPQADKIQLPGGVTRAVTRGLARAEPGGGVAVAFAAKEGTLAQDGAGRHSPFAEALLKHMATPGLDVRIMFGKVRDAVLAATRNEQEPYLYQSLPGEEIALVPGPSISVHDREVEREFWRAVMDSKSPAVLRTYLDRYPGGEFALVAQALVDHYERQSRAELAEREEAKKRQEEERAAEAVRRQEEERRAREAALAEDRRRAEEEKNVAAAQEAERRQRTDWLAQTEALRKLTEEARLTREALAAAEKQRQQAVKEAEDAKKAAEEAIAAKRRAEKDAKLADLALPKVGKIDGPGHAGAFDGIWTVTWRSPNCRRTLGSYQITISRGSINRAGASLDGSGAVRWTGRPGVYYTGAFRGGQGSGTFTNTNAGCTGTWTAKR